MKCAADCGPVCVVVVVFAGGCGSVAVGGSKGRRPGAVGAEWG